VLGAFRAGCEGYVVKPVDREKIGEQLLELGLIRERQIAR
jgi:YesN/AraC family two-component response regulator